MRIHPLVFSVLAGSLLFGCAYESGDTAAVADDVSGDDSSLVGGKLTFERPEIGRITTRAGKACTATLIADNVIVTAAHCFDWQTKDTPGTWIGRFFIERSANDLNVFTFDAIISYTSSGKLGEDDVAVARLMRHIPSTLAVPATLATSTPTDASNTPVTIYGFGCQNRPDGNGNPSTKPEPNLGEKQKREFPMGPIRWTCPGDSGGPTSITKTGAIFRVSSMLYYTEFFGIGAPDDFGNLVKRRSTILAQVAKWKS